MIGINLEYVAAEAENINKNINHHYFIMIYNSNNIIVGYK